jgi:hypothetical protein
MLSNSTHLTVGVCFRYTHVIMGGTLLQRRRVHVATNRRVYMRAANWHATIGMRFGYIHMIILLSSRVHGINGRLSMRDANARHLTETLHLGYTHAASTRRAACALHMVAVK